MTIEPGLLETPLPASLPEKARQSVGHQVAHPSRLERPAEYASLVAQVVTDPMLDRETVRLDGASAWLRAD
ncbi:hypothetical protein [Amycolatopsis sp. cmx-8-4]|uniref:hypothetical protein n=1 Tax=Amycolatopsis sp. cmx-8-4 TaxID=2790947 RepID=UPI00397A4D22